jgi:hypothetical protein
MREAGCPFELRDDRMERAVGVLRRAGTVEADAGFASDPLAESDHEPRLPDPGLARDKGDLPGAGGGAPPTAVEELHLLLAPD